ARARLRPDPMRREQELEQAHLERLDALDHAHKRRAFSRRSFLSMWARSATQKPRPATLGPLPEVARGELGLTFVGHAPCFLRYHDPRILTDPNLVRWLIAVRRAWDPGFDAAQMLPVDLVLVSHAHRDHLVRPSLREVAQAGGATCVVPPHCADLVSDL